MESAAQAVVNSLARRYRPLSTQRIVVVCGKGNNGGDGMAIARQLHVTYKPAFLGVVLLCEPVELRGDAALNFAMLKASGVQPYQGFTPEMRRATLVVDAVLGTGLAAPPEVQSSMQFSR